MTLQWVVEKGRAWAAPSPEWIFGLLAAMAFAYFVAGGVWIGALGLIGGIAVLLAALAGRWALTLAWVVGMPTVFLVGNRFMDAVPVLNIDRALGLVLAGLLILQAMVRPGSLQRWSPAEKAVGLYTGIVVASWLTTVPGKGFTAVAQDLSLLLDSFILPLAALVVARNLTWTPQRARLASWLLVAGVGGYLIAVGLLQHAVGQTLLNGQPAPDHLDRVTGTFANALEYGMALGIVLLMAVVLYVRSASPVARTALLLLMLGLLVGIVLSKGRAAWMSVPLALLVLFLKSPSTRRLLTSLAVVGAVAGPLVLPLVVDLSALEERLSSAGPVYNRVAVFATALNMAAERPLLGFGFGQQTFLKHKTDYYDSWGDVSAQWAVYPTVPHNEFLHVLVLTGIVGLAAYLLMNAVLWRELSRRHREWRHRDPARADLAVVAQGGLLILLVNALFIDLMFLPHVLVLFFFVAGMALRPDDAVPADAPA